MRKNKNDFDILNYFIKKNKKLIKAQNKLSKIFSDMRIDLLPKDKIIEKSLKNYLQSLSKAETLENNEIENTQFFLKDIQKLLYYVNKKNIKGILNTIKKSKYLFKGNVGVRHVDYIGVKN